MENPNASAVNGFFESGRRFFEGENQRRDAQRRAACAKPDRTIVAPGHEELKREMAADMKKMEAEQRAFDRIFFAFMTLLTIGGIAFVSFVVYAQFVPVYIR